MLSNTFIRYRYPLSSLFNQVLFDRVRLDSFINDHALLVAMLRYHHSMDLEGVVFGERLPDPNHAAESWLLPAYRWLEQEVGFYPLFLAVGETEADIFMTGYRGQWRRVTAWSSKGNTYRKKGEFPNYVLFSFAAVYGIYMDFHNWHIAINATVNNGGVTDYEKRLIFKPSWPRSKWLRKARKDPGSVQLVTPRLYLPDAKRIWVRNQPTKKALETMGFRHVAVRRLHV